MDKIVVVTSVLQNQVPTIQAEKKTVVVPTVPAEVDNAWSGSLGIVGAESSGAAEAAFEEAA